MISHVESYGEKGVKFRQLKDKLLKIYFVFFNQK